jgi:hypothetical protein
MKTVNDDALATRKTAADLVEAYHQASEIIDQAYKDLETARKILADAFGEQAYVSVLPDRSSSDVEYSHQEVKKKIKRSAWRRILAITQVSKMLSIKRADEMSQKLENDELPEITLEEVYSMLSNVSDNASNFVREAAAEVFDILRPASHWNSQYKTNQKNGRYDLGEKIILTGYVVNNFSGGFRVDYYREQKLAAIDRVFHALDGNLAAMDTSYRSPLADAIGTSKYGTGQTQYFEFKCYGNRNLHLKFLRMDLVTKLNAINGNPQALKGAR